MAANIYQTVEIPTRFWMIPLPNSEKHREALNKMASAGWELVSSNTVGVNNFIEKIVLTFRKAGQE